VLGGFLGDKCFVPGKYVDLETREDGYDFVFYNSWEETLFVDYNSMSDGLKPFVNFSELEVSKLMRRSRRELVNSHT
jgi:hypothetical protein